MTPEQAGDSTREQDDGSTRASSGPPAEAPPTERTPADDGPDRGSLDEHARREALQRSGAGSGASSSPLTGETDRWSAQHGREERTQAVSPGSSDDTQAIAATASTTGAGSAPGTPPLHGGSAATSVLPTPGSRATTDRARPQPRPAPPRPATRAAARPAGRGRRARLVVQRVDAWSVFLFSLVASVCLGIVLLVAVATLYLVLSNLGVLSSVNTLLGEVLGSGEADEVVEPFFTPGRVLGGAAVLAAVDVVLLTVLATLSALLYNLCASLTGGIEVVLGERE